MGIKVKRALVIGVSDISSMASVSDNVSNSDNVTKMTDSMDKLTVKGGNQQKEKKKEKEKVAAAQAPAKKVTELKEPPEFISDRLQIWDRLKAENDARIAALPRVSITITLPDGKEIPATSWETTPYEVAAGISKGLADNCVVCTVDGEAWDLDRPFEKSAKLKLIKFDDDEGKKVFWHSSAHILGEAMERVYAGHLCYGPPIEEGFYYDMHSDECRVSDADFKALDDVVKKIVKEKQNFERLEMKKSDLLEMFKYNKFKVRILNERVKTDTTTVYRCGTLIDLCRGPHVRHTGKVKAMTITKNSASYWEGNSEAESLQRIYGVSFPDTKQLKEWKHFQEEAAKRDHRKMGKEHDLFFFHELSPGSCFFQPKGAHIYNKLLQFIREEYWKRGFQEVITPNIYNAKLWQTSGHWGHYSENMFKIDIEKEQFGLKPMNCPGHALLFDHRIRSWRELPLRMADFGVLHRNELSGALNGLGLPWVLEPGDGAFYGPKIDITLSDALRRNHQCATIQLDFQLPLRFNLSYVDDKGEKQNPVMIHRAILGSVERMIAVLTENFGGKWPFWLSPRQTMVVPVGPPLNQYAQEVRDKLKSNGYCADVDTDDGNTMNKKVRNAQLAQYNFIFVVGEKEKENRTVNIRTRDNKIHGEFTIDDVLSKFQKLASERILKSEEEFGTV